MTAVWRSLKFQGVTGWGYVSLVANTSGTPISSILMLTSGEMTDRAAKLTRFPIICLRKSPSFFSRIYRNIVEDNTHAMSTTQFRESTSGETRGTHRSQLSTVIESACPNRDMRVLILTHITIHLWLWLLILRNWSQKGAVSCFVSSHCLYNTMHTQCHCERLEFYIQLHITMPLPSPSCTCLMPLEASFPRDLSRSLST